MTDLTTGEREELDALRARVATLEAERLELVEHVNAMLAASQEKTYWLDRWRLDLNALMAKPGAAQVRFGVRAARWIVRQARLGARKLPGR